MFPNWFQIFGAKLIVLFDIETHPSGVARWAEIGFQLKGLSETYKAFRLFILVFVFVSQLKKYILYLTLGETIH